MGWGLASGIYQVEARDAAAHALMSRNASQQTRIIWPQLSTVLRLRNSDLESDKSQITLQGLLHELIWDNTGSVTRLLSCKFQQLECIQHGSSGQKELSQRLFPKGL